MAASWVLCTLHWLKGGMDQMAITQAASFLGVMPMRQMINRNEYFRKKGLASRRRLDTHTRKNLIKMAAPIETPYLGNAMQK